MERREYQLVGEVQTAHWWWRGRRRIIEAVLDRKVGRSRPLQVADIGSGYGANIPMLARYGEVSALEMDDDALARIKRDHGDRVRTIRWKSPEPIDQRFDLMLLADVLEHIPDDRQAVRWIWEHLTDGGHVLVTVPAHQFLWTEMDDVVHHFRRYTLPGLARLFSRGFDVRLVTYYNLVLFPVKLAFVGFARTLRSLMPQREKRSYNDLPPRLVNAVFEFVLRCEAGIIPKIPLPFGVSLVLLARKRP